MIYFYSHVFNLHKLSEKITHSKCENITPVMYNMMTPLRLGLNRVTTMPKEAVHPHLISISLVTQSCPTLFNTTDCSTPGFPFHHQLPELIQTHVHWVGDAIQPSHPLSFPSPSTFNLPSIRVFSNESVRHIRWSKYWSFNFSISLSNEYSGLISFRMDWLDLLAVQGTFKSLLQNHSSKVPVLLRSAFFMVQLSYPHMTTGETIALTRRTFAGKVTSFCFCFCLTIYFFIEV